MTNPAVETTPDIKTALTPDPESLIKPFLELKLFIESAQFPEFINHLDEALKSLANKTSQLELNPDQPVIILIGGRSRMIAEVLWKHFQRLLPEDHPLKRGVVVLLDPAENNALYNKYEIWNTRRAGMEKEEQLNEQGVDFLIDLANERVPNFKDNKAANWIFFEEFLETGTKAYYVIKALLVDRHQAYCLNILGNPENYMKMMKNELEQQKQLSPEQQANLDIAKRIFVGLEDPQFQMIMKIISALRSKLAELVLLTREGYDHVETKLPRLNSWKAKIDKLLDPSYEAKRHSASLELAQYYLHLRHNRRQLTLLIRMIDQGLEQISPTYHD